MCHFSFLRSLYIMRILFSGKMAALFFALFGALLLFGCAAPTPEWKKAIYPIPDKKLVVKGNQIFHHGAPFAELRYFVSEKIISGKKKSDIKTSLPESVQGLAIYYYPYDKEVWIFPAWSAISGGREYNGASDVQDIWDEYKKNPKGPSPLRLKGRLPDKEEIRKSMATRIRISDNGQSIFYTAVGTSFRYDLEKGVSFYNAP